MPERVTARRVRGLLLFMSRSSRRAIVSTCARSGASCGGRTCILGSSITRRRGAVRGLGSVLRVPVVVASKVRSKDSAAGRVRSGLGRRVSRKVTRDVPRETSQAVPRKVPRNRSRTRSRTISLSSVSVFSLLGVLPTRRETAVIRGVRRRVSRVPSAVLSRTTIDFYEDTCGSLKVSVSRARVRCLLGAKNRVTTLTLLKVMTDVVITFLTSEIKTDTKHSLEDKMFRGIIKFSGGRFGRFSATSLVAEDAGSVRRVRVLVIVLLHVILCTPVLTVNKILRIVGAGMSVS